MIIFGAVSFFVLGTIVGSFLNVVILRFNTGVSLGGRSGCFSCGKKIPWYDLIPIFSFTALHGRCRFCKSKLSFQYPLVELLTGLLFLGVLWRNLQLTTYLTAQAGNLQPNFSFLWLLVVSCELLIMSVLVVISVYDLKHKIIPDSLVLFFGVLSLVRLLAVVGTSSLVHFPYLLDLLAGPILALPIVLLWLISGGRWIGLGDAKLALGIGWFLGFSLGVSAVVLGFWLGASVGVFLVCVSKLSRARLFRRLLLSAGAKQLTMKSEIPLAPFLILGLVVVYFSGFDVMGLSALVVI